MKGQANRFGLFIVKKSVKKIYNLPYLGFGIGLRTVHFEEILKKYPQIDWLEIISENFMLEDGKPIYFLEAFAERYPLIPHGVSMAIGSVDPLDRDYLKKLKKLLQRIHPPWFSDHLCWCQYSGKHMYNLLPVPYTKASAKLIAEKVKVLQEEIGIPFLLENVSSYVEFQSSEMPEWEFLSQVAEKADCGILLDVNNVFVSSYNHGFDPVTYLENVPPERVIQFHIAGHLDKKTYLLDTHDHPIRKEVWDLYQKAIPLFGDVSLLLERDDHIPPLPTLLKELNEAKEYHEQITQASYSIA